MTAAQISVMGGGVLTLVIAIFHTRFFHLFGWQGDFQKISPRNAKIHYTIHLALLLLFFCFSLLSFVFVNEIAACTGLGQGLLVVFQIFWLWRFLWQIYYFRATDKRKRLPMLHYVACVIFGALFILYSLPMLLQYMHG